MSISGIFSVEEFKELTDVDDPMLIPNFQTIHDLEFSGLPSPFDDNLLGNLDGGSIMIPPEESSQSFQFPDFNYNSSGNSNSGGSGGKYRQSKPRPYDVTPYGTGENQENDYDQSILDDFLAFPKNQQNPQTDDILDFSNFNFDVNDYLTTERNQLLGDEDEFSGSNMSAPSNNQTTNQGGNNNSMRESMDVSRPNDDDDLGIQMCEEIDRVIVHVGDKKSFRLFKNLVYYRKSTVRARLICKNPISSESLSVFCHLEYKSFKTTVKGEPGVWLPCDTPKGIICRSKGKEKGVFVEYNFPSSGNEIEITYCVTYNVKEMCKNTGKNYIRIHFTVYFGPNKMQEVAIPMIWDTHGKPKSREKPLRVKQLICCSGYPFPKLYYRTASKSPYVPINDYPQGVQPVFISQRYTPNGKRGTNPPSQTVYLAHLLKSVNLPFRYLMQERETRDKTLFHICLMNGVNPKAPGLERAKVLKSATGENLIVQKQTQLAQLVTSTARGDSQVVIYDMNRSAVLPEDVVRAFLFVLRQARKAGDRAQFLVNVTWYYNFGRRDLNFEEKVFGEFEKLGNVLIVSSAGNGSEIISPSLYPTCIPLRKNVVKVGALKVDNLTPQANSNWGCDLWVTGNSTSVACVNTAIVMGYVWPLLNADNQEFLQVLFQSGCTDVTKNMRILNNVTDVVTKKRKREEHVSDLPTNYLIANRQVMMRFEPISVPLRKRRKTETITLSSVLFPTQSLMAKLCLIRGITQFAQSGEISASSFNTNNLLLHDQGSPVSLDYSRVPSLMDRLETIFGLFSEYSGHQSATVSSELIPLCLRTCGVEKKPTTLNQQRYVLSEVLDIVMSTILPTEYTFGVVDEDEEEMEGEEDEDLPAPPMIRNLGYVILDILNGREVNKELNFPAFVPQVLKKCVNDMLEGEVSNFEKIVDLLDSMIYPEVDSYQTQIDKYCEDLIRLSLQMIQKDPYTASQKVFLNEDEGETEDENRSNAPLIQIKKRLNVEDLEVNEFGFTDQQQQAGRRYSENEIVFEDNKNFFITGHAGSGKTWLLLRLAARSAHRVLKARRYSDRSIPVFIPLSGFLVKFSGNNNDMNNVGGVQNSVSHYLLTESFYKRYPFLSYLFSSVSRRRRANNNQQKQLPLETNQKLLMFMDGWESLHQRTDQNVLKQYFFKTLFDVRKVLSSREQERGNYLSMFGFTNVRVSNLNFEQQRRFIRKRLEILCENDRNIFGRLHALSERLLGQPSVRSFLSVPSLLSLFVATLYQHRNQTQLFDVGNSSFRLCSALLKRGLLYTVPTSTTDLSESDQTALKVVKMLRRKRMRYLEYLEKFAFILQCNRRSRFTKAHCDMQDSEVYGPVCKLLNHLLPQSCVPLFKKSILVVKKKKKDESNQQQEQQNQEQQEQEQQQELQQEQQQTFYSFIHPSFQAHLAARYLIKKIKSEFKSQKNVFKNFIWKQNSFNKVYKKNLLFLLGQAQNQQFQKWSYSVLTQLASGLEKSDFIALVHYLNDSEQHKSTQLLESNRTLCGMMLAERPVNERNTLLRKDFKMYKFQQQQQQKEKMKMIVPPPPPSQQQQNSSEEKMSTLVKGIGELKIMENQTQVVLDSNDQMVINKKVSFEEMIENNDNLLFLKSEDEEIYHL